MPMLTRYQRRKQAAEEHKTEGAAKEHVKKKPRFELDELLARLFPTPEQTRAMVERNLQRSVEELWVEACCTTEFAPNFADNHVVCFTDLPVLAAETMALEELPQKPPFNEQEAVESFLAEVFKGSPLSG